VALSTGLPERAQFPHSDRRLFPGAVRLAAVACLPH